jgi:hypothetical protein
MIFGDLRAGEEVLDERQPAIGDVAPPRHAAAEGSATQNSRCEHGVVKSRCDEFRHRGNEQRRVLVIRMHHDGDVRPVFQCQIVARLLIAAVSEVPLMHVHRGEIQGFRDLDRFIMAGVIHHDHPVHDSKADHFRMGADERSGGVVSRHDDYDFSLAEHGNSG